MNIEQAKYPIIDFHCDLLFYLATIENSHPANVDDIGCAIPHLRRGNVKAQVMAIYSTTEKGCTALAYKQAEKFKMLADDFTNTFYKIDSPRKINKISQSDKIGMIIAIESASGLCEEDDPLEKTFENLEKIQNIAGRILYISLTHHGKNRFGGGNMTDTGLTDDGRVLLDYLSGRKISIDLSHTCDALAFDILNHIDRRNLDIEVIASHSNFRSVYNFPRNIPDELAREVIRRNGLIGINFIKAFVNPDNAEALYDHILHGFNSGAEKNLCFAADFFSILDMPGKEWDDYYHKEFINAEAYQDIIRNLDNDLSENEIEALAYKNGLDFLKNIL